jgi:hypothetical protein
MISLTEILVILFIHWLADFVLQTDKQAKGKSKNWSDLLLSKRCNNKQNSNTF